MLSPTPLENFNQRGGGRDISHLYGTGLGLIPKPPLCTPILYRFYDWWIQTLEKLKTLLKLCFSFLYNMLTDCAKLNLEFFIFLLCKFIHELYITIDNYCLVYHLFAKYIILTIQYDLQIRTVIRTHGCPIDLLSTLRHPFHFCCKCIFLRKTH